MADFDVKSGLGYGVSGASLGSAGGPIPAAILGVGGFLAGGFLGGGSSGGVYSPGKSAFNAPGTQYVDNPARKYATNPGALPGKVAVEGSQWGVPDYWQKEGDRYAQDPNMKSIDYARARQLEGIALARRQAMGGDSFASAAARAQGNMLRAQAGDASAGGNRMSQRNAMVGAYGQHGSLSNNAMLAEQAERQKKMGIYSGATGQLATDDTGMWKQQGAWQQAKSDMSKQAHMLGQAQKEAQRNAMIQYEMDKMGLDESYRENAAKDRAGWLGLYSEGAKSGGQILSLLNTPDKKST